LHAAAFHGHAVAAEVLLSFRASINTRTEDGARAAPLHIAAARNHTAVAAVLLAKGASVNARDARYVPRGIK
jgi:ankyrin repeat protein